jgi:hypothetical protein
MWQKIDRIHNLQELIRWSVDKGEEEGFLPASAAIPAHRLTSKVRIIESIILNS